MRDRRETTAGVRGAIRRRSYLVPVGVVLTALFCLLAAGLVPAKYEVTARVLVFPYSGVSRPTTNPYLALGGLDPAASVLAEAVSSAESKRELVRRGATGAFTVTPDVTVQGPVLLIDVHDVRPVGALATLNVVVEALSRTLKQLQSQVGVPADLLLSSTVVSRDSTASVVRKSQVRAVLVAGVGGIAGTFLGISLLDAVLLRRRSRVAEAAGHEEEVEPLSALDDRVRLTSDRT